MSSQCVNPYCLLRNRFTIKMFLCLCLKLTIVKHLIETNPNRVDIFISTKLLSAGHTHMASTFAIPKIYQASTLVNAGFDLIN